MKSMIKGALKKTLAALPILKRNAVYHGISDLRDRLHSRPDPARSKYPAMVQSLMRDGVVSVDGFASQQQVSKILEQLEPEFELAKQGRHPAQIAQDRVYHRLSGADQLAPSSSIFYQSDLVWDVVRATMSPKAESIRREAELRCRTHDDVSAEDLFHFDTWHPNFKAFLYLTDVDEYTAPFRYLVGSHQRGAWRRKREIEFECDGFGGSFGHFFPGEVKSLQRAHGFEERVFTGKAGTLIIGDFRGLHRGTPLRTGQRILLNQVFNILDWSF